MPKPPWCARNHWSHRPPNKKRPTWTPYAQLRMQLAQGAADPERDPVGWRDPLEGLAVDMDMIAADLEPPPLSAECRAAIIKKLEAMDRDD